MARRTVVRFGDTPSRRLRSRKTVDYLNVIRHVGASRSLLQLCFRQVCGKSILEDILDVRLAEVRRQLKKTRRPVLQIGRDCGFKAPNYLKRLFKKRFGMSMREYRAQNRTI